MNKLFLAIALLFSLATLALLWATQGSRTQQDQQVVATSGEETSQGKAAIGGAFSLSDQQGIMRTDKDFRGKIMLVFFGFTRCPDICPITVNTFSALMEQLGEQANQVAPIFVSVDPERDTTEVMQDYLSSFDKRIVGLTGTKAQIRDVADAYKVYFAKAKRDAQDAGQDNGGHMMHSPVSKDEDYFVDHSGYIYMMDRKGNYLQHFTYDASVETLATALQPHFE